MMKTTLIVISGYPATGKTTIGSRLSQEFEIPHINKDDIKESLFESLGTNDLDCAEKLYLASFNLLYFMIEMFMLRRKSVIVDTYFDPIADRIRLLRIKNTYDVEIVEINCSCDRTTRLDRFKNRYVSGKRHHGHVDDQNLEANKAMSTDVITAMNISDTVIHVDTTNFDLVDYDKLINVIRKATRNLCKQN